MTQKVKYTNADIINKLDGMDIRIAALETWKVADDAARAAVDKYKAQESQGDKRKLVRDVGAFLGVLTLLIWVIIQFLSTHK